MKKRAAQKKNDSNEKPQVNLRFVHKDLTTDLEDEFPFESIMDFLPSRLEDQVCLIVNSFLNMDLTTIKEFLNLCIEFVLLVCQHTSLFIDKTILELFIYMLTYCVILYTLEVQKALLEIPNLLAMYIFFMLLILSPNSLNLERCMLCLLFAGIS
jgi:hypothetical protein